MAGVSRVTQVRDRVKAIRATHPDWPTHRVAKLAGIGVEMARRILREPPPPSPLGRQLNHERFNWKQQGQGCDRLLQRVTRFHSIAEAA